MNGSSRFLKGYFDGCYCFLKLCVSVFVNPVEDKDYLLADGGVRNHILTEWILDEYNLSETISIFARPEDFKKPVTKKELKGTFKVLERTIEIMQFEISKSDEQLAKLKCSEKNVDYKSIYIKNILNNVYEESKDKQIETLRSSCNNP